MLFAMKTLLPCLMFLLLASCGAPESPSEVVEAYLEAAVNHDTETMRELLVEAEAETLKEPAGDNGGARPSGRVNFAVAGTEIDGDHATVRVTYSVGDDAQAATDYHCVREDGRWKVSLRGSMAADGLETSRGD